MRDLYDRIRKVLLTPGFGYMFTSQEMTYVFIPVGDVLVLGF